MSEGKPRLARLAAIMTLLQSKRVITAREIADQHDVSIRTVYRDIRTLEQSGVPIYTEEGKGYSIMEGYTLPPIMFTEDEANALITAEHIITQNKDVSLVDHYSRAIVKIKSVLRRAQKEKTEILSERIQVRPVPAFGPSSDYLMRLQRAITHYELCRIRYLSAEGETTERPIEPFALYHTQGNWILISYCRLRMDFRAFRLDRIQILRVHSERFTPHELTLEEYFDRSRKKWNSTPDTPLTFYRNMFASHQTNSIQMQDTRLDAFQMIGISIRTAHDEAETAQAIGALWRRFISEDIAHEIPNRLDAEILSVYTNYIGDHTGHYDVILGCRVSSLDQIPEGMVGHRVDSSPYKKTTVRGNIMQGLVYKAWKDIWSLNLDRAYKADFEIYGENARNPTDAEVDIYVGINQ